MTGVGDGASSRGERGTIAAEQIGVIVLVAAVVSTLFALAVPGRVRHTGAAAVACLFTSGPCELPDGDAGPSGAGGDALGDGSPAPHEVVQARRDELGAIYSDNLAIAGAGAQRLADIVERDGGDLATWEGFTALRDALRDQRYLSDEELDRYFALADRVEAAPDGSLLADLRDVDASLGHSHLWTEDEIRRFEALEVRRAAVEEARRRGERLARWADEGRDLLWLDPTGDGRVAEVVHGDLADADHVAVVIPGTGNDLDNYDRNTRANAQALAQTLAMVDPGAKVAVVACLCYDAPDDLLQAARPGHAERGAGELAGIIDTIRGYAPDANLTALGHSYGSTALGQAITQAGLTTDASVHLGSPGLGRGVGSVDDLPGGAGQVWGVRHDKDPIDLAGMHGRNPDRGDFGGHSFGVGDGDLERTWWKPYQFDFHGIYYADETSLNNLAHVVLGRGDETTGYREGRR